MSTTITEPLTEPFEVETDPRREVLWRAADLIEEWGWVQCSFGDRGEPVCIMGAVGRANEDLLGEYDFVALGPNSHRWMRWNDRKERTKEEVVAKLRELADRPLA